MELSRRTLTFLISWIEPLFLSCAETDHTFDATSRNRAVDILISQKKSYHLQLFSGVEHGFALRGDPDDPYQRQFLRAGLSYS